MPVQNSARFANLNYVPSSVYSQQKDTIQKGLPGRQQVLNRGMLMRSPPQSQSYDAWGDSCVSGGIADVVSSSASCSRSVRPQRPGSGNLRNTSGVSVNSTIAETPVQKRAREAQVDGISGWSLGRSWWELELELTQLGVEPAGSAQTASALASARSLFESPVVPLRARIGQAKRIPEIRVSRFASDSPRCQDTHGGLHVSPGSCSLNSFRGSMAGLHENTSRRRLPSGLQAHSALDRIPRKTSSLGAISRPASPSKSQPLWFEPVTAFEDRKYYSVGSSLAACQAKLDLKSQSAAPSCSHGKAPAGSAGCPVASARTPGLASFCEPGSCFGFHAFDSKSQRSSPTASQTQPRSGQVDSFAASPHQPLPLADLVVDNGRGLYLDFDANWVSLQHEEAQAVQIGFSSSCQGNMSRQPTVSAEYTNVDSQASPISNVSDGFRNSVSSLSHVSSTIPEMPLHTTRRWCALDASGQDDGTVGLASLSALGWKGCTSHLPASDKAEKSPNGFANAPAAAALQAERGTEASTATEALQVMEVSWQQQLLTAAAISDVSEVLEVSEATEVAELVGAEQTGAAEAESTQIEEADANPSEATTLVEQTTTTTFLAGGQAKKFAAEPEAPELTEAGEAAAAESFEAAAQASAQAAKKAEIAVKVAAQVFQVAEAKDGQTAVVRPEPPRHGSAIKPTPLSDIFEDELVATLKAENTVEHGQLAHILSGRLLASRHASVCRDPCEEVSARDAPASKLSPRHNRNTQYQFQPNTHGGAFAACHADTGQSPSIPASPQSLLVEEGHSLGPAPGSEFFKSAQGAPIFLTGDGPATGTFSQASSLVGSRQESFTDNPDLSAVSRPSPWPHALALALALAHRSREGDGDGDGDGSDRTELAECFGGRTPIWSPPASWALTLTSDRAECIPSPGMHTSTAAPAAAATGEQPVPATNEGKAATASCSFSLASVHEKSPPEAFVRLPHGSPAVSQQSLLGFGVRVAQPAAGVGRCHIQPVWAPEGQASQAHCFVDGGGSEMQSLSRAEVGSGDESRGDRVADGAQGDQTSKSGKSTDSESLARHLPEAVSGFCQDDSESKADCSGTASELVALPNTSRSELMGDRGMEAPPPCRRRPATCPCLSSSVRGPGRLGEDAASSVPGCESKSAGSTLAASPGLSTSEQDSLPTGLPTSVLMNSPWRLRRTAEQLVDLAAVRSSLDQEVDRLCRSRAKLEAFQAVKEASQLVSCGLQISASNEIFLQDSGPRQRPPLLCRSVLQPVISAWRDVVTGDAFRPGAEVDANPVVGTSCDPAADAVNCGKQMGSGEVYESSTAAQQLPSQAGPLHVQTLPANLLVTMPSDPDKPSSPCRARAVFQDPALRVPIKAARAAMTTQISKSAQAAKAAQAARSAEAEAARIETATREEQEQEQAAQAVQAAIHVGFEAHHGCASELLSSSSAVSDTGINRSAWSAQSFPFRIPDSWQHEQDLCSESSWRFACLVVGVLQACHLAGQVRGLSAASKSARLSCERISHCCIALKEQCLDERMQSFVTIRDQKELLRNVDKLSQCVLARRAHSDAVAARLSGCCRSACEARSQLLEAQAAAEAQKLVHGCIITVTGRFAADGRLQVLDDASANSDRHVEFHVEPSSGDGGLPDACHRPKVQRSKTYHAGEFCSLQLVDDAESELEPDSALAVGPSRSLRPAQLDAEEDSGNDSSLPESSQQAHLACARSDVPQQLKPETSAEAAAAELEDLRGWLASAAAQGFGVQMPLMATAPGSGPRPPSLPDGYSTKSGLSGAFGLNSSMLHGSHASGPLSVSVHSLPVPTELLRLLAGVLQSSPKLLSASAPSVVRQAVLAAADPGSVPGKGDEDASASSPPAGIPVLWDAQMLEPWEHAQVLREGVAVGAVDPALLAAFLGCADRLAVRQAFCSQWVAAWLGPYLQNRSETFGEAPNERRLFAKRAPQQHYWRQCGRVIVDAMRDLFGVAMRLTGVEQEGLVRLLEDFARALCSGAEMEERFRQALLPAEERPQDVRSLEHAVFLLSYHALLLNTALHNPAAKGRGALSRQEFAAQGKSASGMQVDTCKKMYDLIKATPFG
ncbi:unnamed protein product [Polarella glacialis]|uniref:SEC7 domain-containing protein n=1 Tax=Polarella glacialis TaxID=89957 RepID=A0A813LBX3_POLGL|nr:unnamed protein product [Polarella glacialis]